MPNNKLAHASLGWWPSPWEILDPPSSGSSGRVRGGPRNMKSMRAPLAAIFFMTYFHRPGGPWPPRPPLGSATATTGRDYCYQIISRSATEYGCPAVYPQYFEFIILIRQTNKLIVSLQFIKFPRTIPAKKIVSGNAATCC